MTACLAVAALVVYFYALLFHASVVMAFGANYQFTLKHYRVVFAEGFKAIHDTRIIACCGMLVGGLKGVVVDYLVAKKDFISRQVMEVVSMINYSLPGTIVGIAYLVAFKDRPFMITGTALILIACYVFRNGATGIRTTVAILQQIDPSIEEASYSLDAGTGTTFRRITIPLVLPVLFTGLGVVFIQSMTAISATIFIVSINWVPITVRIPEKMTELEIGVAAVFSIFVIAVVWAILKGSDEAHSTVVIRIENLSAGMPIYQSFSVSATKPSSASKNNPLEQIPAPPLKKGVEECRKHGRVKCWQPSSTTPC